MEPTDEATVVEPTEAAKLAWVGMIEARRQVCDYTMWQAPTLTIAAQAFLLGVITDTGLNHTARGAVLAAGVMSCLAAIGSLLRLRSRELLHSRAVARHLMTEHGLLDPRPSSLIEWLPDEETQDPPTVDKDPALVAAEKRARQWAGAWRTPSYLAWIAALVLFIVADGVALGTTWTAAPSPPAANAPAGP